jgi:hypothetical protein
VAQHCAVEVGQVIKLVGDHPAFADPGRLKNKLSLIVPRIVLLIVPKTSAAVWVLILLFGTPTGIALLTTLTTFVATLVLATLATLIPLLAALILPLILRHHYLLLVGISHGDRAAGCAGWRQRHRSSTHSDFWARQCDGTAGTCRRSTTDGRNSSRGMCANDVIPAAPGDLHRMLA